MAAYGIHCSRQADCDLCYKGTTLGRTGKGHIYSAVSPSKGEETRFRNSTVYVQRRFDVPSPKRAELSQPSLARYHLVHFLGAHTSMLSRKSRINDPCCEGEPCTALLTDNTFASAASTYSPAGEPAWLYSSLAVDKRYLMQDGLL